MRLLARATAVAGCLALAGFYAVAATEHGRRVNVSKARGDQSGYLWDAQNVYKNWNGQEPPIVIGERNRMPAYAGYLALFWDPAQSDDAFFEVAKRANIYLSLVLLALVCAILIALLPRHAALNVTGVAAFGYFIFKASYAQSELLYYFLFFATFLGCWRLLESPPGPRLLPAGAVTGALAGVAHLTKAALLPLVAIVLTVLAGRAWASVASPGTAGAPVARRQGITQLAAAAVLAAVFFAVMWPYLSTSKRVFGRYFYNVNSTFYVWYDNWPQASVGTYRHGDGVGWPTLPDAELPSASRYWREHTLQQIGARFVSGFRDMAIRSYTTFGYLKYIALYGGAIVVLLVTRRRALLDLIHSQKWLAGFIAVYAVTYAGATAFYEPTSGTGTARFLMAHLLPFFYAASRLVASRTFADDRWLLSGVTFVVPHFQWLVTTTIGLDVVFGVWPRLMSTYGGF